MDRTTNPAHPVTARAPSLRRPASRAVAAVRSPFMLLALASALSVAVIGILFSFQLRHVGAREAARGTERQARLAGIAVVAPALTKELLRGEPEAIKAVDDQLRESGVLDAFVRIKVWEASGRVVYSDEHRLIGRRFSLAADDLGVLSSGRVDSELSDLSRPENRFERGPDELVEAYLRIPGPDGEPLLFEAYQRFSSVTSGGQRLWRSMLPSLLGGLLLLFLANFALARWALYRLQRGDRQRAALLQRALDASDFERRRLAADLHDGVVQDLTAVSLNLSATGRRLQTAGDPATAATLEASAQATRDSVRSLRSLLVEVYPPDLAAEGLPAALRELLRVVNSHGIATTLDIDEHFEAPPGVEALLYRTAQEGVRNSTAHSGAERVGVSAGRDDERAWLEISDDGRGFDPEGRAKVGHLGLRALQALLQDAGGQLTITSSPGHGTVLRANMPMP